MPETQAKTLLIDHNRCISCGICVSLCPHNALTLVDRYPEITGKCKVCGLCASSCITKAITLSAAKFRDESLISDIDVSKKIVVFSCRRNIPKEKEFDASVVSILCSGRIDISLIADAFVKGVEGVIVATCGKNCRNYPASEEAISKVKAIQMLLKKIGEDENRVTLVEGDFSEAIESMKAKVNGKVKNAELLKMVTLDRDVRALVAKMRTLTEVGNVYGEVISAEDYERKLDKALDKALKMYAILQSLNGGERVSRIVEKTQLSYNDVMDAIVEMKRKGLIEFEVKDEIVVLPKEVCEV